MSFNPFAALPFTTFVAAAVVCALIWARPRRRGAAFAPVALGAGSWSLGVAVLACLRDDAAALWIGRATVSAVVLVGPAAISFMAAFGRSRRRRTWIALALVPALGAVAATMLDPAVVSAVREPPWGGRYPVGGPRFGLPIACVIGTVLVTILWSAGLWRRARPGRRRRQAGVLFLSYLAGIAGGVDVIGIGGGDLPPIGWATSLLALVCVYYAMARDRLPGPRAMLLALGLVAVYVAALLGPLAALVRITAGWAGWQTPLPRAAAVVTILAAGGVYAWQVERWLRRLVRRRHAAKGMAVERFAVRARGMLKPPALLPYLEEALHEGAGLTLAAVGLGVDLGDGGTPLPLVLRRGAGEPEPSFDPAPPGSPLPAEPVARGELDAQVGGDARAAAWMEALGADVLVPMWHAGELVGVIAARSEGGDAALLGEADRAFLARLAAHAAVAFTNAVLHDALERRAADLEVEVRERTKVLQRAIENLKIAQASLVQAEKQSALGILVAGVSHEINNALNFIYGNLPVLEKYAETYDELFVLGERVGAKVAPELLARARAAAARLVGDVSKVADAAQRARAIVDDLRRFARHDEAERKRVDVREGLASTLNLLGPELRGRIAVERRFAEAAPLALECFPSALNHVFLNVLLNAAQAIEGEGTIVIDAARRDDGGVVVTVRDDGAGFPAADAPRVFEPFFTTKPRAAGLGLAVSRQIVERHGGDIALAAAPGGRGTTVTIILPGAPPAG